MVGCFNFGLDLGFGLFVSFDKVDVVVLINVWGLVVQVIGGDKVNVYFIIDSFDQDLYDYEVIVKDKFVFLKVKIVIINGGGYDDWVIKFVKSISFQVDFIDVVEIFGFKKFGDKEFNEYVFYLIDSVCKVVKVVEFDLVKILLDNKFIFEINFKDFEFKFIDFKVCVIKVGKKYLYSIVIVIELVVGYLFEDMKIKNIIFDEFVEQFEIEVGLFIKVVYEIIDLLIQKKVFIFFVNG